MRKAQLCKGPFLPRADLEPHWIPHSRRRLDPPDPGEHCPPTPPPTLLSAENGAGAPKGESAPATRAQLAVEVPSRVPPLVP